MQTVTSPSSQRLRILWLSHFVPYPPKGGALMRGYNLLKQTVKHHDVDLFAFNQSKLFRAYFPTQEAGIAAATEHLSKLVGRLHIEHIPVEQHRHGQTRLAMRSLLSRYPYTINWLRSDNARRIIAQWISDGGYDLVHFDTESLAPYLDLIGTLPTMMDHHNAEAHMLLRRAAKEPNLFKRTYYWQEGRRLARYEKRTLHQFGHHIVCSEDDRQRLLAIDPKLTITVIPNGIDVAEQPPERTTSPEPKLLFIGGLDWYPNRDAIVYFLADIWPLIKARYPSISIDIIGKNPPEELLKYRKRDPAIRFHGFVDDISAYYRDAAVYVCPIRDGGGTKLKILDALVHRLPLVAHAMACEGIKTRNGVHLLAASEPQQMTEAVCKLLADPEYAQSLGDAGYSLMVEAYDFKGIGHTLAKQFEDIAVKARLSM